MKLIIAGGRDISCGTGLIESAIHVHNIENNLFDMIEEIVSGGAQGMDASGEHFAERNKFPVKLFPADWDKHGRAAGPIRNKQMAEYADALLLIWDGSSKGSKNMKETMLKLGKPVYEVILRKHL